MKKRPITAVFLGVVLVFGLSFVVADFGDSEKLSYDNEYQNSQGDFLTQINIQELLHLPTDPCHSNNMWKFHCNLNPGPNMVAKNCKACMNSKVFCREWCASAARLCAETKQPFDVYACKTTVNRLF